MNWSYTEVRPSQALKRFVDCFWYENYSLDREMTHHVVPDNSIELIFTDSPIIRELSEDGVSVSLKSQLSGLKTKYQKVETKSSPIIALRFKPNGLFPFIKEDVSELLNQAVSPWEIFPKDIRDLEARVLESSTANERIRLITEYFIKKVERKELDKEILVSNFLNEIHASQGMISITTLSIRYGKSVKSLERDFKQVVGIMPKKYCRLVRAIHAMKQTSNRNSPLTDVAHDCGYFDQAHFIKDLRLIAGLSPSEFRKLDLGIQTPFFSG